VFAEVDPDTLLIDPADAERKITSRTRAIVAVDYAGQPCDYDLLNGIAARHDLVLVADACHALGAKYKGKQVGILADLTVFSFHPVKHITTGEGGMVVTDNADLAEKIRRFRNHGINTDHRQREIQGTWIYEMQELGYNYRITDIQCALGMSQMKKLPAWLSIRQDLAGLYATLLRETTFSPLKTRLDVQHAYHLYVGRLPGDVDRKAVFQYLRGHGIGINVHYLPVYLHPYYRKTLGTASGLCPMAERAYARILTLPLHQAMEETDVSRTVALLKKALENACTPYD
jgi:perosamine synthetase